MGDESYYTLLGLEANASNVEIKRAYRRLARDCHPDLYPGDLQAEMRFKELSRAAAVLSDPRQRMAYDQLVGIARRVSSTLSVASWEESGYEATEYLTLTPTEASLGAIATFTYYDAGGAPYMLQICVPPGTAHGQRLRITGAGGPARRGAGRGDLVVIVRISEQASVDRSAPAASPATPLRTRASALLAIALAVVVCFTCAILSSLPG